MVHSLISVLLSVTNFLLEAWKILSAIRASPGGAVDNQSYVIMCCVRAVCESSLHMDSGFVVVVVCLFLFLCFLFAKGTVQA